MKFIKNMRIGDLFIYLGIILGLIGLIYLLDYSDSIYLKYSLFIGIILFGIGIFLDGFKRTPQKNNKLN
ncbi:hypothetical protein LIS77_25805 (plasmid) [Cytobacillus firmus]|uniref:hypothetical protein n=1 Tax=Cytobacillus firmus TaxID=1399 RepID=UPI002079BDEB|nr:hypothetical protein [Cytobacillus firmus]USK41587.1 hypothetical protein LIS77_25805 [Cytobacillus firmus]